MSKLNTEWDEITELQAKHVDLVDDWDDVTVQMGFRESFLMREAELNGILCTSKELNEQLDRAIIMDRSELKKAGY